MQVDKIRKKHKLALILLHGSQVAKKLHQKSDLDIAVLPEKGVNFDLLELIADLNRAFGTDRVDIVNLSRADPLPLFAVSKKSKLLSGNKDIYQKLKLKAFRKYNDYLPYLEKERVLVLKKLKSL